MALVNERVRILENECVGPNLYLMTLSSPAIAAAIEPGQFVHMKIPGMEGHVLRRPFSVYAADAAGGTLDVLYQTVGFGTNHLAALAPDVANEIESAELIGPVGRRWQAPAGTQRALLVGGGVGVPPLYNLAKRLLADGREVAVVLGFNTAAEVFYRDEFAQLGCRVVVATADGTEGVRGFVTDAIRESGLAYDYFYACGPLPMLRALSDATKCSGQLSFEERMGCGFGACMGCSCKTKYGNKRICKEGPVLTKEEVIW